MQPERRSQSTAASPPSRARRALASSGKTMLLTTQNLDEPDDPATRIAVIDHGRAVAEDTAQPSTACVPRQDPPDGGCLMRPWGGTVKTLSSRDGHYRRRQGGLILLEGS